MSVASVTHSPTRWIPDSPRRKPPATTMTTPAKPPVATRNSATNTARVGVAGPGDDGENVNNNAVQNDEEAVAKVSSTGSRISFAPGTTFHNRSRLRSRGSSKKVPATFTLRQITPGEKPQTPQMRFKLPKATLPSLHYLSVSQEDFLDPRYAEDIVKTYGIPRYFFKSKSNLLTSASKPQEPTHGDDGHGGGGVGETRQGMSEDAKQKDSTMAGKEVDGARPKTSGESAAAGTGYSNRLPIVLAANISSDDRAQSADILARDFGNERSYTGYKTMAPLYKPLIGEKYTNSRFCPPMNPYRSLQMENEVTKYVEHKKRVGLGRYVQFVESDDNIPTTALVREASMYDLNHQGPAERPLDQYLPPPDRKPFIRQRPRDPKNDFVRSAEDRNLVIMPKERTTITENNGVSLKDLVRR